MNTNPLPLISVVVPVYNIADYLDRCVRSICEQVYDNLQVLLIDDGSTDASAALCDDWAAADTRVEVVHMANAGSAAARNAGMKLVRGEFLVFVDGDDAIGPRHILNLYSAISSVEDPQSTVGVTGLTGFDARGCTAYDYRELDGVSLAPCIMMSVGDALSIAVDMQGMFGCHVIWKIFPCSMIPFIEFPEGKVFEDVFVVRKTFLSASAIVYEGARDYCYTIARDGSQTWGDRTLHLYLLEGMREMLAAVRVSSPEAVPAVETRYQVALIDGLEIAYLAGRRDLFDDLFSESQAERSVAVGNASLPPLKRVRYKALVVGKGPYRILLRLWDVAKRLGLKPVVVKGFEHE